MGETKRWFWQRRCTSTCPYRKSSMRCQRRQHTDDYHVHRDSIGVIDEWGEDAKVVWG